MQGFKEVSKTHITLNTDQNSKIDFVLPIGNVTETVTVNSSGSQIELSKADRGLIIDAEQVQELPTDGRNVLELFALSPGGTNLHNPQFTRSQDNVGNDLHSNGLSGQPVQENLDGSTNDNPSGFAVGFVPPLDSVAEFKVVLNPYDASYGRAGGGAIEITLKSGTNKIHGDIYDYWRRPWLDANSFGNDYTHALNPGNPIVKPQHKRDQFGLEVDGPVYIPHIYNGRDKTFFTIQWEQGYENLPDSGLTTSSIPNSQWLTGDFSGAQYYNTSTKSLQPLVIYDPLPYAAGSTTVHLPFPGNIIPATCTPTPPNTQCSHLNPVGLALAQYYAGITPNNNPGAGVSPYTNNLVNQGVESDISRTGLVKLEHNFGERDRGSIRWGGFERYAVENRNGVPLSNPSNAAFHQIQPKDQTFAIDETHTFSPTFILDNKANVDNLKLGLLNGVFGNFAGALGFSSHTRAVWWVSPVCFQTLLQHHLDTYPEPATSALASAVLATIRSITFLPISPASPSSGAGTPFGQASTCGSTKSPIQAPAATLPFRSTANTRSSFTITITWRRSHRGYIRQWSRLSLNRRPSFRKPEIFDLTVQFAALLCWLGAGRLEGDAKAHAELRHPVRRSSGSRRTSQQAQLRLRHNGQ